MQPEINLRKVDVKHPLKYGKCKVQKKSTIVAYNCTVGEIRRMLNRK